MSIRVNFPVVASKSNLTHPASESLQHRLEALKLDQYVSIFNTTVGASSFVNFELHSNHAEKWAPESNTMHLCASLGLDTLLNSDDLEREILLAMLLSPIPFEYASYADLAIAVRIRTNVVNAARKTALDFHTTKAERPADFWVYDADRGFTILPGKSLITALEKATQPENPEMTYSFSCYRATEYIILLAIAQELYRHNPEMYQKLEKQWESMAIKSGPFHEAFLCEYGSMAHPLPAKFYVPGDRVWFRNPDKNSSDVLGYEGSWVIYLGSGLFSNFWNRDKPYTLTDKCVEIFHWRNAVSTDPGGELQIDETIVEKHVQESIKDQNILNSILAEMMRYRDPSNVNISGGCIDTTREYPLIEYININ